MISCRPVLQLLIESRDRTLDPAERQELTAHATQCAACREAWSREEALAAALSDLRDDAEHVAAPDDLAERAWREAASRRAAAAERPTTSEVPVRRLAVAAGVSGLLLLAAVALRVDDGDPAGRIASGGPSTSPGTTMGAGPSSAWTPALASTSSPLLYSNGSLELVAAPAVSSASPSAAPDVAAAYLVEEWDL